MINNNELCNQTRLNLQDYYDNKLPADKRASVYKHLKSCTECRQCFYRLKQVSRLLAKWQDVESSPGFMAGLDAKTSASARPVLFSRVWISMKRHKIRFAAAAALLISITAHLIVVFFFRETNNPGANGASGIKTPEIAVPSPETAEHSPDTTPVKPEIIEVVPAPPVQPAFATLEQGTLLVQSGAQAQPWAGISEKTAIQDGAIVKTGKNTATISLSDNSKIRVDRNTVFSIRKDGEKSRANVVLTEGSIYLDVAHNEQKPLYVETPVSRIRVVGTQLTVAHKLYMIIPRLTTSEYYDILRSGRSREDTSVGITVVMVDDGKVIVEYGNPFMELKQGERIALGAGLNVKVEVPDSINAKEQEGLEKAIRYYLGLAGRFDDEHDLKHACITEALLQSYGRDIIPYLIQLLKTPQDRGIPIVHYHPAYISRALGHVADETIIDELVSIVKSDDYWEAHRGTAACTMFYIDEVKAGEIIMDILKNAQDAQTKKICISSMPYWTGIGYETNSEFIRILTGIIKEGPENELFMPAVKAFSNISDPSVLEMLYGILESEKDYLMVIAAARAIFMIEGKDCLDAVMPPLYEQTAADDNLVILSVIKTIIEIEGKDAGKNLMTRVYAIALGSKDPQEKIAGLNVAFYFLKNDAAGLFQELLTSSGGNEIFQQSLISEITGTNTPESVDILVLTAQKLMDQWRKKHPPEIMVAPQTIRDYEEKTSIMLITALREIENPKTLPAFRKLLDNKEPDFRLSAAKALGKMGEKEDILLLENMLEKETDDYLQQSIRDAIKSINSR